MKGKNTLQLSYSAKQPRMVQRNTTRNDNMDFCIRKWILNWKTSNLHERITAIVLHTILMCMNELSVCFSFEFFFFFFLLFLSFYYCYHCRCCCFFRLEFYFSFALFFHTQFHRAMLMIWISVIWRENTDHCPNNKHSQNSLWWKIAKNTHTHFHLVSRAQFPRFAFAVVAERKRYRPNWKQNFFSKKKNRKKNGVYSKWKSALENMKKTKKDGK